MTIQDAAADRTCPPRAARFAPARHLLVDLDGTLIREDEVLDGAAELLANFEHRYAIVSNNSTHTAHGVAHRLGRLGLSVSPGRIVLAGEQTVEYMRREHPDARILLVATGALRRYASERGCRLVESGADFVVLALDPQFDEVRLGVVAGELRRGARLIVSNADAHHPGRGGTLVPETGALLDAVARASGVQPACVIGKPGPLLWQEGLRRLGAQPQGTIVIGDNPNTDGAGAARMGMPCLLVGGAKTLRELLRA